jgi:hypothetical protein
VRVVREEVLEWLGGLRDMGYRRQEKFQRIPNQDK